MEGGKGHGGGSIGIGPDGNAEPGAAALEEAAHRREKALYVSEEGISFCHRSDRLSFLFSAYIIPFLRSSVNAKSLCAEAHRLCV